MTEAYVDWVPEDRQSFGRGTRAEPVDSLGEAMRRVARALSPQNTAKFLQRRWKIDPSTAENITKSQPVASASTLVKAIRAERGTGEAWALWDALGEALIGTSRDEYEELRVLELMKEAQLARARLESRRARRERAEATLSALETLGR